MIGGLADLADSGAVADLAACYDIGAQLAATEIVEIEGVTSASCLIVEWIST